MVAEKELQTFSAFEGRVDGSTIKGVSLIQEGPALGHGVWVDNTTLSQVKKLAAGMGKVKAKLDHWSAFQNTIGYYDNFRVRSGKLLADLKILGSHPGREQLLEMVETMPESFGVSIMFRRDEPEYDKANDRYNTRVKELYSADFVDTPAANRDGVFDAQIDSGGDDMADKPTSTVTLEAFEAYKTENDAKTAEVAALKAELTALKTALEAKPTEAPKPPEPAEPTGLAAEVAELKALLKAFKAAPTPSTPPAPANEPENIEADPNTKTRKEFDAIPVSERSAFFAGGGKIKD
jgi:hypothetical protein